MLHHAYEEVSHLDTDAQRQLLQKGDEVERVWAAWALGVAQGAQIVPELISSLHESPAPGTRRTLLVILAGFGDQEILRTLAQFDPDEYVRATACQYLIRIDPNADTVTDPLVRERLLDDPSAIVRQAILAERSSALPVFQFEDLARLANDSDVEVRQLATERLLATHSLDRLFPGILEDRIPHEPNAALRRQLLVQCLKAGGSRRLTTLGQVVPLEFTLEILNVLIDYEVQIEWEYLAPLCLVHDPRRDILLMSLMRPTDTLSALSWLLRGMARATYQHHPRNRSEANIVSAIYTFARFAEQSLLEVILQLQDIRAERFEPQDVQGAVVYLQQEIEQMEGSLQDEWEEDEPDMDAAEYERALSERRRLLNALEQLRAI